MSHVEFAQFWHALRICICMEEIRGAAGGVIKSGGSVKTMRVVLLSASSPQMVRSTCVGAGLLTSGSIWATNLQTWRDELETRRCGASKPRKTHFWLSVQLRNERKMFYFCEFYECMTWKCFIFEEIRNSFTLNCFHSAENSMHRVGCIFVAKRKVFTCGCHVCLKFSLI